MIHHQGVLIQQKIPLKTQCFRSQRCQMLNVNLNLISQHTHKNLICSLTLKREEGFYTKLPYLLNFKWATEFYLYFFFSLTLHLTYFLQPFCIFYQYAGYTTSNERSLKKLLFYRTWVTLEKSSKFDTLHSYTHF